MSPRSPIVLVCVAWLATSTAFADAGPKLGDLNRVGTVDFPTSCSAEAQPEFLRGVALLHSFFYGEARRVFEAVAEREPACAMAHWGVAKTWFHPLWTPPSAEEIAAALAAVEKAETAEPKSERERAYIEAIATLYRTPAESDEGTLVHSCHGVAVSTVRRSEYVEALDRLRRTYPDDDEAAAFYALSLLKPNPGPDDVPIHLEAAAILERIWERKRDHPGVVHYLIHAYDYPPLAERGLAAANHYAEIAPWVPHVLHMPSHIYTRLGMWERSLASNQASAEAARAYGEKYHPGKTYFEELHALDYLVYAHLQRGEDAEAKAIVDQIMAVEETWPKHDLVAVYAVGAVPARHAIERHDWKEAVALPRPAAHLVERFPFGAAHVEFARAVGHVRLGDTEGANEALTRIRMLGEESTDPRAAYFRRQLEIQAEAVASLIAHTEGRTEDAVDRLRRAADQDDLLGKHPVSPGNIFPVRELLAELLLDLDRPVEALAAFEQSLELNPGRLNALRGAALAAERAGERESARRYHRQVLDQAGHSERPEARHAREVLGQSRDAPG